MIDYSLIKWIHIISATILFGTGLGSAFYKWCADKTKSLEVVAHTNRLVVIADWLFTTPTIIIQPLTGYWLLSQLGLSFNHGWIILTFVLYLIAGLCWLPVVWLQIRMRDISIAALNTSTPLGTLYKTYARIWFWLGVPAFIAMIAIYFLMVFKPGIGL